MDIRTREHVKFYVSIRIDTTLPYTCTVYYVASLYVESSKTIDFTAFNLTRMTNFLRGKYCMHFVMARGSIY